jgi:phosphatidylserine/phosphatidylglycerophosphate/cardiolipin synthase-like enzyme
LSASRITGALAAVVLLAGCGTGLAAGAVGASGQRPAADRSRLSLIAEPQAGARPFLSMIRGARSEIDLTMYELSDRTVEHALAAAAARGVDVRVALNGGYYTERSTYNAPARAYLSAHGVQVRYTPTYFALTHQKTLTVDGRMSAIMTLNFDGLYASTRDYAILDRRLADVRAIVATFDDDWAGRRDSPSHGSGDLVWSPGAAGDVLGLIGHARRTIELEDEEMDYDPATAALCAAARRGVRIRVVMSDESDWRAALQRLRRCGAGVRLYHGQAYYIHAKALVADGRVALVGSQNLSFGSLQDNRELGITVSERTIVSALQRDIDRDYAGGQAQLDTR